MTNNHGNTPLKYTLIDDGLSADLLQKHASDPTQNVWVGASAGTGKTKVLTDRVLRLMLPSASGEESDPSKILCITFTKAAAAEMRVRLQNELSKWLTLPDAALKRALENLTGQSCDDDYLKKARRLFARVVDTSGGMKIKTINSFCESVLRRFPLEAGISPDFTVLSERDAKTLLNEVVSSLMTMRETADEDLNILIEAYDFLLSYLDEDAFNGVLKLIVDNRSDFVRFFEKSEGLEKAIETVYKTLGFDDATITRDDIAREFWSQIDWDEIRRLSDVLHDFGGKKDKTRAVDMQAAYDAHKNNASYMVLEDLFRAAFLNADNTKTKKLAVTAIADNEQFKPVVDRLYERQNDFYDFFEITQRLQQAVATKSLLVIAYITISRYQNLKKAHGVLDFDDQIAYTVRLMHSREDAAWVLFKLDNGIDHILLDEAQDTNPDQWDVVRGITQEFFAGIGRDDKATRTVFIVGDEKQSIYSFQKADPAKFDAMQHYFAEKLDAAQKRLIKVPMNQSFRSTKAVLKIVDDVFSYPAFKKGLTIDENEKIHHRLHRAGQAGHVELWPLVVIPENKDEEKWPLPIVSDDADQIYHSNTQCLADHIAITIKKWLDEGRLLISENRPVKASDMMILLQKRGDMMQYLVRALKSHDIPVAGVDRLNVTQEIAIMDVIALAQWCLLPDDDLNLACVLKAPFIGLNEEELMEIAIGREKKTLWAALQASQKYEKITHYLYDLRYQSAHNRPYEFFNYVLNMPCPAHEKSAYKAIIARLGYDAVDPMNEFLLGVLNFEQNNRPVLQSFIQWFSENDDDVKRDMETSDIDQVRIMTVHGSKGLQAPIVFLADAAKNNEGNSGQHTKRLFWQSDINNEDGLSVPLWAPVKALEESRFQEIRDADKQKDIEESRRLFYVAMTRARDEIYIAGEAKDPEKIKETSWYYMAKAHMQQAEDVVKKSWQASEKSSGFWSDDHVYVLSTPQEIPHDKKQDEKGEKRTRSPLPHWAYQVALPDPKPYKPYTPSKPITAEPAMMSPLSGSDVARRFKRGTVLHKLLQILPDIPSAKWESAARHYLKRHLVFDQEAEIDSTIEEIVAVLKHPEFSHVFGPGSRAEVPVTGLLKQMDSGEGGYILSGVIDRLVIAEKDIYIIDFKTNRPPPSDVKDVPPLYKKQMQAYKDALAEIYPHHTIHTALLWTDTLNLMIL